MKNNKHENQLQEQNKKKYTTNHNGSIRLKVEGTTHVAHSTNFVPRYHNKHFNKQINFLYIFKLHNCLV